MASSQKEKAERFAALHRAGCFVLPNAWDAASAVLCEHAGFAALGTSSAGIALVHGLPDGEAIGREGMLLAAGRIAAATDLPVSVDLEAGYGLAPEAVAESVRGAIAAGCVGCNLEDSDPDGGALLDADAAAERIGAAAEAALALDGFVVNARVDTYWRGMQAEAAFVETIARANRYRAAGAACIFVPGPGDEATARALAAEIDAPLNLMAGLKPPAAPLAELEAAGVRRASLGASLMATAYGGALSMLERLREDGRFEFPESARPGFLAIAGQLRRRLEKKRSHA